MSQLTIDQEVEAFKRRTLAERVALLPEAQRAFFESIHSYAPWKTWEKLPSERLDENINLCNRSLGLQSPS